LLLILMIAPFNIAPENKEMKMTIVLFKMCRKVFMYQM
jgi:hypothetical protein